MYDDMIDDTAGRRKGQGEIVGTTGWVDESAVVGGLTAEGWGWEMAGARLGNDRADVGAGSCVGAGAGLRADVRWEDVAERRVVASVRAGSWLARDCARLGSADGRRPGRGERLGMRRRAAWMSSHVGEATGGDCWRP